MAIEDLIQINRILALMCLNHFDNNRDLVLSPLSNFCLLTEAPNQLLYCGPQYFFHRLVLLHLLDNCLHASTYRLKAILAGSYRVNHPRDANQHHRHCLLS